ncbi:hypothetical protein N8T08_007903 [Aspergillus melleus]|uniref:Uncharacterized protein n=1 Tax=Aspergillus melleus TaxID=138277 RepID=A0ACC3AXB5_9EURO|nr:hypothetical protein N8T08_007903 [Aspergillus melleus]
MIQCDWVAVDFCYYAIFVEIHRMHLKSCFTPHIYRECLIHSRKSLEAFHFLQKHSAQMPGFDDPYPSFLTWTLFLYPLSAFFVVFCHIVGTSDTSDFQLRQITEGLLHFKQDPHLRRLLTLLQSLQRLCEPLFQKQSNNSATGEDSLANANHSLAYFSGTGGPATESFTFPQSSPPALFRDDMPLVNEAIQNAELDPSAEWQMWQLFTNQVPHGWLNKGVDLFDL